MRVILDTDIGADSDDAVALGYLCSQVNKGRCELPLISLSTARTGAAACTRAILSAYGVRAEIARMEQRLPCDEADHYALAAREKYGFSDEAAPFLEAIRKAYVSSKEKITLIVIGPQTNLKNFINSYPELFLKRTNAVYIMGGNFQKEETEWNILCDVAAAKYVCEYETEVPCLYLPFEEGAKILTGKRFYNNRSHPVGFILERVANAFGITEEEKIVRESWDPLTCLAVFKPELFEVKRGDITIDGQGVARFSPDAQKNQFLLTVKNDALCTLEIEKNLLNTEN